MADKLTKAEITENIHNKTGIDRDKIAETINALFEELKSGLADGRTIELRGFGTFEVKTRMGKKNARNPKTGEVVSVDKHRVVTFRQGKELKDLVWDLTPKTDF